MTFSIFVRVAVIAATALFAGCVTKPVGPDNPGTKVRYRTPDPDKWVGQRGLDYKSVFRCRPLACPENSIVTVKLGVSPTRSPDPQALQKFAQDDAARQMAIVEEASSSTSSGRLQDLNLLTSTVTKAKDYPAVHWEYRGQLGDKSVFIVRKLVFAGSGTVDVISSSLSLDVARRNSADFVALIEVEDYSPQAR